MSRSSFFFLICGLVFNTCLSAGPAEPFGLVMARSGENFVTRGILEFEAQIEETLMWEDEIETGDEGSLQITFDSSFLSIGPNTLVSFHKEHTPEGEELLLMKLEEGSFRSKILNLGSRQFFEVETENGKLRVRGTDFVTTFDPEAEVDFNVSVLQGLVAITNQEEEDSSTSNDTSDFEFQQERLLSQHQTGGFEKTGEYQKVTEFSYEEANQLKEEYPIPGDDEISMSVDGLGIAHADVESFTESIQESQTQSQDPVVEDILDDVFLESEFELVIKARIDPDA